MIRRDFLKRFGFVAAGVALTDPFAMAADMLVNPAAEPQAEMFTPDGKIKVKIRSLKPETNKQITAIIIGAGNRGRLYARYAENYPEHMKVVGVSDILESRFTAMSEKHNVPAENRFGHYDEVFKKPKFADVVVVSTPDDRHLEPCLKALEMGYDVLLEKPAAQTEEECLQILRASKKSGRIVGVCHVLRYSPYFIALKKVVDSGVIGDLVNIQHFEPIQYAHMAHSYVRGNWRSEKQTTPIILAKS